MDTASFLFIFFGLGAALVSNLHRSAAWRSAVLMLATLIFLGVLGKSFSTFVPLFGFLVLGYVAIVALERRWLRSMRWAIIAVLCTYVWLKRYSFLPGNMVLHFPYFSLGISYIVFRVLLLIVNTGEGSEKQHIGFGSYLLYTVNFTTLVTGPIQQYDDFARDQFARQPIPLGPREVGLQVERMVRGFFKVNVLAMLLQLVQEDALAQLSQPLPIAAKLVAAFRVSVVYPFFLYANFSGYIDIVIALGRLMRLRLPENFDRPFSATSFLDFWSRWHITLSVWFKTYLYNPLLLALMRRVPSVRLQPFLGVACFFITFFFVGVWHGRTSEFLIYGVLQGGGVSLNKLWQVECARMLGRNQYKALARNSVYIAASRGLTFTWLAFTLFWFWASWEELHAMLAAVGAMPWLAVWIAVWLSATVVLASWERTRNALLSVRTAEGPVFTSRYARVVYGTALALASFIMTVLLSQPAPAIVYKAF